MSFISAYIYDIGMARFEKACLKHWRRELLEDAHGDVLEIGAGTGASIEHYSDRVTKLVLTEPDQHLRRLMRSRISGKGVDTLQISDGTAEHMSAEDESLDCVVAFLVCCSVANLRTTLEEMRRVLKTGGHFVFLEHVAATEGTARRRWQNRLTPLSRTMGYCHLNRETEEAIIRAGFKMKEIKRESVHQALLTRQTIRGIAEKA